MRATLPNRQDASWRISTDRPSRQRVIIRPSLLLPILLFIFSFAINLNHVGSTEFHPDETRWINRAHYFTDLRDPFGPTWKDQYITRGQPPLGSYLMGLGLLVQGRDTRTNNVWDFAYGSEWNSLNGAMTSDDDLRTARRTNAFVGAVTVVVVFLFVNAIGGLLAALAAGMLLALHPLQIWISSQALSDELLVMLIALALLAIVKLAEKPTRARAIMLGILLGLGGATKLSPLPLAFALAMYGIALLLLASVGRTNKHKAEEIGPLLMIQPAIAVGTFILSYPYLWPDPLSRTWNLFELRAQEMTGQSAAWPGVGVDNPIDALGRIYDRLTWQFSTTGSILEAVVGWFRTPTSIWGFDLVFALLGLATLTMMVVRRGLTSGTALAAFLLAGQAGAIIFGMQVDFYRYHLPIVLATSILGGLGVSMVWRLLAARGASRVWNIVPGISVDIASAPAPKVAPGQRVKSPAAEDVDATRESALRTGIRS